MIDLFAGTGGFSLGFHATGMVETVYANDIEKCSKVIYEAN
jgi:site-specific DNA-cytosine methylase